MHQAEGGRKAGKKDVHHQQHAEDIDDQLGLQRLGPGNWFVYSLLYLCIMGGVQIEPASRSKQTVYIKDSRCPLSLKSPDLADEKSYRLKQVRPRLYQATLHLRPITSLYTLSVSKRNGAAMPC